MERPPDMKWSEDTVSVIIITLFHVVGLIGFWVPALTPIFLRLVPFHLLLMLVVLCYNHKLLNLKFWIFALLVCVLGITAEWIGVHKNWIFGDYDYGQTLGPKIDAIPYLIGVNWFMLVYATGVTLQRSGIKNVFLRIAIGSVILVLLDILIEPVAIRFDYWSWVEGNPPLKNFICWLAVSALFLALFEAFKFERQSKVAVALLMVQFVFFALLQL
jgi:bisanhydrobacterioruberin hydratase